VYEGNLRPLTADGYHDFSTPSAHISSARDGLVRKAFPMHSVSRFLASIATLTFLCTVAAHGQDQPSLGDFARRARLQKQQKDADAGKDAAPSALGKDATTKDAAAKDSPQIASPKDSRPNDPQARDTQAKDTQAKDTQAKDAPPPKAKRVITNDEIPEHTGPARPLPKTQAPGSTDQPEENTGAAPAEYWKGQILAAKNNITSLQGQIASLSDSIQYAGANCVSNCVQWNERQQQKQQQVEAMKQQLDQAQKQLEDLQDAARKQGFGSSVYEP
jgi:hypothetical protein